MDNTVFSKEETNRCTPVNRSLHSSGKNRSLECTGQTHYIFYYPTPVFILFI